MKFPKPFVDPYIKNKQNTRAALDEARGHQLPNNVINKIMNDITILKYVNKELGENDYKRFDNLKLTTKRHIAQWLMDTTTPISFNKKLRIIRHSFNPETNQDDNHDTIPNNLYLKPIKNIYDYYDMINYAHKMDMLKSQMKNFKYQNLIKFSKIYTTNDAYAKYMNKTLNGRQQIMNGLKKLFFIHSNIEYNGLSNNLKSKLLDTHANIFIQMKHKDGLVNVLTNKIKNQMKLPNADKTALKRKINGLKNLSFNDLKYMYISDKNKGVKRTRNQRNA